MVFKGRVLSGFSSFLPQPFADASAAICCLLFWVFTGWSTFSFDCNRLPCRQQGSYGSWIAEST